MAISLAGEDSAESESNKRKRAVEAALTLIEAYGVGEQRVPLDLHMDRLTKYADQIQEALKVKAP